MDTSKNVEIESGNGMIKLGSRVKVGPHGNPVGAFGTVRALQTSTISRLSIASIHLDGTPNIRLIRQMGVNLLLLSSYDRRQVRLGMAGDA
jgi:hypothetical protein